MARATSYSPIKISSLQIDAPRAGRLPNSSHNVYRGWVLDPASLQPSNDVDRRHKRVPSHFSLDRPLLPLCEVRQFAARNNCTNEKWRLLKFQVKIKINAPYGHLWGVDDFSGNVLTYRNFSLISEDVFTMRVEKFNTANVFNGVSRGHDPP